MSGLLLAALVQTVAPQLVQLELAARLEPVLSVAPEPAALIPAAQEPVVAVLIPVAPSLPVPAAVLPARSAPCMLLFAGHPERHRLVGSGMFRAVVMPLPAESLLPV